MRNRKINYKAIADHSRRIFSITQTIPQNILTLLGEKRNRQLTEKEHKQVYQQIKQKNLFSHITTPKILIQLCSELSLCSIRANKKLVQDGDLYIVVDGGVKVYEKQHNIQQETQANNVSQMGCNNNSGFKVERKDTVLSTKSNNIQVENNNLIEKKKINIGDVLLFEQNQQNLSYFTTLPTILLRVPNLIHTQIAMNSFMIQIKRKQQFFNKMSIFQKHYRSSLEDFVNSLEEIKYGFDQKIFEQGQKIQNIYIVKQGEFLIQKSVSCDNQLVLKRQKLVIQQSNSTQNLQKKTQNEMKKTSKHFRKIPYKIIGPKQILGAGEYIYNDFTYFHSMRCHREGSVLYSVNAETFFEKIYVPENGVERANAILEDIFYQRRFQIQEGIKFNKSNQLILKIMPNSTMRYKASHSLTKFSKDNKKWVNRSLHTQNVESTFVSTNRSNSFFQRMNKTITNENRHSIRRRKQNKTVQSRKMQNKKKSYKTPAIVSEVIAIVNQKKEYHRLRNLGIQRKGAFQFDINNVPAFIKKKYGRLTPKTTNIN